MFPKIRRMRKKGKIGSYEMQKQCQLAMKELELEHGKCLQRLPSQLMLDYNRVCKLKDIPRFYSQYFTYFVAQGRKQSMQKHFDEQIDNMMLGRSYYDKISTLIKQRAALVIELQSQLGSLKMALSWTELRKFVTLIISLRENLKQMIESVISWQFWLRSFVQNDKQSDSKEMKIVFPQNGINCIFIGLYDMQILETSFLGEEIGFSSMEFDPFLTQMQLLTNTSKMLKDAFYVPLSQGIQEYKKVGQYLFSCIPLSLESEDTNEQNKGMISQRRALNTQRLQSTLKTTHYRKASTKSTNQLNQPSTSHNQQQQARTTMSNSLMKSAKRIQHIYKYSNSNLNNKNSSLIKVITSKVNVINSKVNVITSKEQPSYSDKAQPSNSEKLQLQKIVRQKEQLMKELRSQKIEREQLNRIVKQVESRTFHQHRLFEQKTQRYQRQIHTLKTKSITNNNLNNNNNSSKLISKVYQHNTTKSQSPLPLVNYQSLPIANYQNKDHEEKRAKNMLLQKVSQNRLLEEKINQLMMEKNNLERLVEREGMKADKQRDAYERKLQNYQQTIQKLKYQSHQLQLAKQLTNQHQAIDLITKRQQRQQSVTKIYTSKRKKSSMINNKNTLEAISPQERTTQSYRSQIKGASHNGRMNQQSRKEDQQSRKERGLVISNRDDAIEIVYSPQKQTPNTKSISTNRVFNVYQQFIKENQLSNYISKILALSSQDILHLNHNSLLLQLVKQAYTLLILIAKHNQIQIGISILHKQQQHLEYVCDYLLVHDTKYFLPIVIDFTRFIFQNDLSTQTVVFNFRKDSLKQSQSIQHFAQFQQHCKSFGQVFVNSNSPNSLKYLLKRELFYDNCQDQKKVQSYKIGKQRKGIVLQTKLQVHQRLMKQKTITNKRKLLANDPVISQTFLLSFYLKTYPELLSKLKSRKNQNINNHQLITLSNILSQKKLTFEDLASGFIGKEQKAKLQSKLGEWLDVSNAERLKIQEMRVNLEQNFQTRVKRCSIGTGAQATQYCMLALNQQLNKSQSTNSKQTATFLPITSKYELIIIPASQFLTFSQSDTSTTIFSYICNFIKSTHAKTKYSIPRVFLPEIKFANFRFYKQLSQLLGKTITGSQELKIGYEGQIENSVICTPRKNDLVIQKPFIVGVLSTAIENIAEGCPILCTLVS